MHDSVDFASKPLIASLLWVNLTREAHTALGDSAGGAFDVHCVREPAQIPAAIERHAPQFLCFEFDEPEARGINAIADTRRRHPSLPVLMITACHSEPLALWALRIRVWDLLVKPVLTSDLSRCIRTLFDLTRQRRLGPAREIRFPQQAAQALPDTGDSAGEKRTHPAVLYVASHYDAPIALEQAAALCRLSPTQFCRIFRQEQGATFGQHLLHYRLEQARERLAHPGALIKEVAYSVGFNDLSYFTRAFKRQLGVCPSEYQSGARLFK